jgi:hypothetical protein
MGNRDINDAHPRLKKVWAFVAKEWPKRYPADPAPFLSEVYRSPDLQRAYYAQGREPIARVNSQRRLVGLGPLTEDENRRTVTNSKPGQSKHQKTPSEAIDISFARGKVLLDDPRLYQQLVRLIDEVDPAINWGGHFRFVDKPHFEI